ncbi:MAG: hypothetical protein IPN33_10270 [Saprospiraceae bacterium]|nr:hypothetical protein [Saprospiraceae bacterium]
MKLLSILVIASIGCFTCYGQEESTGVPFVSYWNIGDAYDFKITKIKQKWDKDSLVKNDTTSYIANFSVVDSTHNSYTIKWLFKTNLSELKLPEELTPSLAKYDITEVIYKTSEVGEFLGIENWEAISDMMTGLFSDITTHLSDGKSANEKAFKTAMAPILSVYQSKEGIEQLVFKELQYFHLPFGVEFSTTEPFVYEEKLPNMFGGDPIRADGKIYVENVDFDNNYCTLIQELKLNPSDTKKMVDALLKQMKVMDKDMKQVSKNAKIEISDHNRYEYYYYPGIPINVDINRETIMEVGGNTTKQLEIIQIEFLGG